MSLDIKTCKGQCLTIFLESQRGFFPASFAIYWSRLAVSSCDRYLNALCKRKWQVGSSSLDRSLFDPWFHSPSADAVWEFTDLNMSLHLGVYESCLIAPFHTCMYNVGTRWGFSHLVYLSYKYFPHRALFLEKETRDIEACLRSYLKLVCLPEAPSRR